MDIAQASMSLGQANVQQQAGMAVMRMAMDNSQVQGDAINQLAEGAELAQQAAPAIQDPSLGTMLDVSA
ncbi:MAG: YjfB family protein [Spirochaeta sp.]|nr:YjfB family protein [Spirochaeta sp.]